MLAAALPRLAPPFAAGGGFLVVCCSGTADRDVFGINPFDSVTLLDGVGAAVSATGAMTGDGGSPGVTYAWDGSAYAYTSAATPGAANAFAPVVPRKERLRAQNERGTWFFGMDGRGETVEGFDPIVTMRIEMKLTHWNRIQSKAYEEIFRPFARVTVETSRGTEVLESPGRIRPRGQSTLALPYCLIYTMPSIPFGIDFASTNASQTLFGMERAYLRTGFADASYVREWAMHRALARFGLPHLRTRHVHLRGRPARATGKWGGGLRAHA